MSDLLKTTLRSENRALCNFVVVLIVVSVVKLEIMFDLLIFI